VSATKPQSNTTMADRSMVSVNPTLSVDAPFCCLALSTASRLNTELEDPAETFWATCWREDQLLDEDLVEARRPRLEPTESIPLSKRRRKTRHFPDRESKESKTGWVAEIAAGHTGLPRLLRSKANTTTHSRYTDASLFEHPHVYKLGDVERSRRFDVTYRVYQDRCIPTWQNATARLGRGRHQKPMLKTQIRRIVNLSRPDDPKLALANLGVPFWRRVSVTEYQTLKQDQDHRIIALDLMYETPDGVPISMLNPGRRVIVCACKGVGIVLQISLTNDSVLSRTLYLPPNVKYVHLSMTAKSLVLQMSEHAGYSLPPLASVDYMFAPPHNVELPTSMQSVHLSKNSSQSW